MFLIAIVYAVLAMTILATFVAEPAEVGLQVEDDHVTAARSDDVQTEEDHQYFR